MTRTLQTLHNCRGGVCVLLVLKCRDAGMRPRRLPKMLRSLGADSKPAAQQAEKMRKTESQRMQRLKRFNAVIFRRGFWSSPKLCGGDRDSTHWLSVVLPIILEPITCRTDHWHLRLTLSWGFFDFYLKKHPSSEDSTQWTRLVADPAVESHGICMHLHAFAQINLNHPTLVISLSLSLWGKANYCISLFKRSKQHGWCTVSSAVFFNVGFSSSSSACPQTPRLNACSCIGESLVSRQDLNLFFRHKPCNHIRII